MSPSPASSTRQIPTLTTPDLGVNRTRRRLLADARERMVARATHAVSAALPARRPASADRAAPSRHHRAGAVLWVHRGAGCGVPWHHRSMDESTDTGSDPRCTALSFVEAVWRQGSLLDAWPYTHPTLRLCLAQIWLMPLRRRASPTPSHRGKPRSWLFGVSQRALAWPIARQPCSATQQLVAIASTRRRRRSSERFSDSGLIPSCLAISPSGIPNRMRWSYSSSR